MLMIWYGAERGPICKGKEYTQNVLMYTILRYDYFFHKQCMEKKNINNYLKKKTYFFL